MLISFSDYFKSDLKQDEDWFNPIVVADTELFIDPFLVDKFGSSIPEFKKAHDKVISFFNETFQDAAGLVQRSGKSIKPLLRSLKFPETKELYLGYSKKGNYGSGSGDKFSKLLLGAIFELIDAGIISVSRFEELDLFKDGFGADRIGDMMGVLLKPEFVSYTNRVCKSLGIKQRRYRLRYMVHTSARTWQDEEVVLPCLEDEFGKNFVVLVPKCFLRHLPSVDVENFWDYCYSNENDIIRAQFGADIKKKVDRKTMFEAARKSELRRAYLESLKDKNADPYDLYNDPDIRRKWYELGKDYCSKNLFQFLQANNDIEFVKTLEQIINRFKHFVEEKGGWEVLRDDDTGKGRKEKSAQRLFEGIVWPHCEANNIDYSPEVDAGRGPVDFKFASGYRNRALIEVKLARNTRIVHGLDTQLPIYLKSSLIKVGFLIVITYEASETEKINYLKDELPKVEKKFSIKLNIVTVNAQKQEPASKAKK